MTKKFVLGKGLDALIHDYSINKEIKEININEIKESPYQPRKNIPEDSLIELIDSIRENGIIEPLVAREKDSFYELIAGHRRLKALIKLKKETVPVYIIDVTDEQAAQLSLIENIQRKELNPIELSLNISKIIKEFNLTHDDLAKKIGKSRVYITNLLRLLSLDNESINSILDEKITESHGRLLLQISNTEDRKKILNDVLNKNLTVKELDKRIRNLTNKRETIKNKFIFKDLKKYETKFKTLLNRPVKIKKNKVEIYFKDETDIENIFKQFKHH